MERICTMCTKIDELQATHSQMSGEYELIKKMEEIKKLRHSGKTKPILKNSCSEMILKDSDN